MAGGCRRGSPNIGISQCGAVQFAKPKIVPSTVAYFESASGLIRPVPILENRASTDAVADRAVVCRRNRFHPFSRAPLLLFKCSHTRGANGCAMAAMRGRVLVAGLSAPFPSRHSFSTFSHNLRHLERDGPCGSAPKSPGELIPPPSLGPRNNPLHNASADDERPADPLRHCYAAKRNSRTSSKICRKAGSGARHMVRYVFRKGSQLLG